ncbi:MAG: hypothetical protein HZB53_21785 [Chloroflexi bacterium]|nr:hypothetical protein [Chloroflexota bacterium]
MANFMLLYGGGGMPEGEAEQKAVMAKWMEWYGNLGSQVVDAGNPFTPAAKTITANGKVNDSPPTAFGYTIIKADSLDAATEAAKGCPILTSGGQITVNEIIPYM